MKKIILLALAIVPAALFAQEKYVINGKVGSINAPAKVYLSHRDGSTVITDSTTIANGAFTFNGEVKDITRANLIIDYKAADKKEYFTVFLVNGTTVITSPDSLKNASLSGTKVNEDNQRYNVFLKPVNDAYDKLNAEYDATPKEKRATKEFNDHIDKESDSIDVQSKILNKQFVAANPDSYISLTAVQSIGGGYPDVTEIEPAFNTLSPAVRGTAAGIKYQQYIAVLKTVMVGANAPEFAQADTNGKMISLSSFKGKYVLLDFWASWCGPCRRENPNVVKAFNSFKGKNFTILSVSLDRPGKRDAWIAAIKKDGLAWNHVSDLKFWDNDAAKLYGIQGIPQNFLLDPDGKIIAHNLFGDDLEKKLAELFGKI